MISVLHFDATDGDFADRARTALTTLAERPGYVRGRLARSTDDDHRWVLITEWHDVGSYRRALGSYEVKLHATSLLAETTDDSTAFETLVDIAPGGVAVLHDSDRA